MKKSRKMGRHSITNEYQVLKAVRLFRYVTRRQLVMYFTKKMGRRIKALEEMLPDFEQTGKLAVTRYGGEKIYSPARKNRALPVSIAHEHACTDILIRLLWCRMGESEIIPEKAFRGFSVVPEFGIRYSENRGTMLIFEHSTKKNVTRQGGGVIKSKITRYRAQLADIEEKFQRDAAVLFILDVEREQVRELVKKFRAFLKEPMVSGFSGQLHYPFYFCDYQTFKVPVGTALTAEIYFGHEGKEYSLTKNE